MTSVNEIVTAIREKYFEADTKDYYRKFEEAELTAVVESVMKTDPYTTEEGA